MSNPYAPPEAREDCPREAPAKDTLLRRIGAISMAYCLARALFESFPDLQMKLTGMGMMVVFICGFLRGGRKSHLGIALFMALSIPVQTYFMNRVVSHPERFPIPLSSHPWLEFAVSIIPHSIALICAAVLYFRARRAAASSWAKDKL